jgi:hypothetical protein
MVAIDGENVGSIDACDRTRSSTSRDMLVVRRPAISLWQQVPLTIVSRESRFPSSRSTAGYLRYLGATGRRFSFHISPQAVHRQYAAASGILAVVTMEDEPQVGHDVGAFGGGCDEGERSD